MSTLFQTAKAFKARLLEREKQAESQMLLLYGQAYRQMQADAARLTQLMEFAAENGERIDAQWLFRRDRLKALMAQIAAETARFSTSASLSVRLQAREAIEAAQSDTHQLVLSLFPPAHPLPPRFTTWNRLPARAVEQAAANTAPGGPVEALFIDLADKNATAARSVFVTSVAIGRSAADTADLLRRALGTSLTRALTISRTETLRAYRDASLASYQANSDVVDRWRWTASKSGRTCAMCLAMDGQEFGLDEPFGSHANCRCSPVPVTKSWEELGIEGVADSRPEIESGADWFARQDADMQRQVLGPAKYNLFQAGDLALSDLVGYHDDPDWGPVRYEKSLKAVV